MQMCLSVVKKQSASSRNPFTCLEEARSRGKLTSEKINVICNNCRQ